jgi:ribonuclease-3
MSKGEEATGGRTRDSALADGFEALIGAVFLDGGFEEVQRLVRRVFAEALNIDNAIPRLNNPKGELQEMLQVTASSPPQYVMISVAGLEHDRIFECAVLHDGKELARGTGKSKKAAESMAAMAALKVLKSQTTEKPGAAG